MNKKGGVTLEMRDDPRFTQLFSGDWRKRILSDEQLKAVLEQAEVAKAEADERKKGHYQAVNDFLKAMLDMGYRPFSPEYKYVHSRVRPLFGYVTPKGDIQRAQDDLKKLAEEQKRDQERRVALVKEAEEAGVKYAHLMDDDAIRKAIRASCEERLQELKGKAPYYVLASYYGQCLRSDWSNSRHSYGCDELRYLAIPPSDPEHEALRESALELQRIADGWDGEDGRDFREAYQEMDSLFSPEEKKMLDEMVRLRYAVN